MALSKGIETIKIAVAIALASCFCFSMPNPVAAALPPQESSFFQKGTPAGVPF